MCSNVSRLFSPNVVKLALKLVVKTARAIRVNRRKGSLFFFFYQSRHCLVKTARRRTRIGRGSVPVRLFVSPRVRGCDTRFLTDVTNGFLFGSVQGVRRGRATRFVSVRRDRSRRHPVQG